MIFYGVKPAFEQALTAILPTAGIHAVFLQADRSILKLALQKPDVGIIYLSLDDSTELHEILNLKDTFQKDTQVILHYLNLNFKLIEDVQESFDLYRILTKDTVDTSFIELLQAVKLYYLEKSESKNLFVK